MGKPKPGELRYEYINFRFAHSPLTSSNDNQISLTFFMHIFVTDEVTLPNVEGDDTSSEDVNDAQGDGEDDGDVTCRRKTRLIHVERERPTSAFTCRRKTRLIHVERERPTSAFDFHPLRNQKLKLNNNSLTKPPALATAATPDAPAADASTDVIDATTAVPMTSADTSDVNKDSAHDRLMRKQDGCHVDPTCKKRRDDVSVRFKALCLGVASVLWFGGPRHSLRYQATALHRQISCIAH